MRARWQARVVNDPAVEAYLPGRSNDYLDRGIVVTPGAAGLLERMLAAAGIETREIRARAIAKNDRQAAMPSSPLPSGLGGSAIGLPVEQVPIHPGHEPGMGLRPNN